MKITQLQKGDVFQWGEQPWDGRARFHSVMETDGRLLIMLMGMHYQGDVSNAKHTCFTWRDTDVEVFIPEFYRSEQRRTKGTPCVPVSNHRHLLPGNLNPINISDRYCEHDKYWYDLAALKK